MLNSNPNESDSLSVARGAEAFQKNCARCHGEQADGKGAEAAKLSVSPTDFTSPIYSKSAARLAARISYGKGDEMPAYSETLPYDTVWDIANYLESLQLKR